MRRILFVALIVALASTALGQVTFSGAALEATVGRADNRPSAMHDYKGIGFRSFVSLEKGVYKLKDKAGDVTEHEAKELSRADRAWLQQRIAMAAAEEKAKARKKK